MLLYFASLKAIFINFLIYIRKRNLVICIKNQKIVFLKIVKVLTLLKTIYLVVYI
jgi:hypothetical protein